MFKIPNMKIVGLHFYVKEGEDYDMLKKSIGKQILLEREPENKYDKNAIVAHLKTMKLGYVPRVQAKVLSPAIKGNVITFGKIKKIEESPLRLVVDITVKRRNR